MIRFSALAISLSLVSQVAEARSLRAYLDNTAGILQFRAKQYFPAYTDFLKALGEDPLNPDLQMNLGITFELNEDYDKAEKSYLSAEELAGDDKARKFMALFNLGGVRVKKEDVDGALEAYQAALEIEPESLEVKTNIELLFQSQQGQSAKQNKKNGKGKDNKKDKDKDQNQDQDKDKDKKDQDKDQDKKDQNKDKQYEQPKQQPRQFQSKDLSKDDVRKILDEIQSQEKSIRAKESDKGARERKNDKDW